MALSTFAAFARVCVCMSGNKISLFAPRRWCQKQSSPSLNTKVIKNIVVADTLVEGIVEMKSACVALSLGGKYSARINRLILSRRVYSFRLDDRRLYACYGASVRPNA